MNGIKNTGLASPGFHYPMKEQDVITAVRQLFSSGLQVTEITIKGGECEVFLVPTLFLSTSTTSPKEK